MEPINKLKLIGLSFLRKYTQMTVEKKRRQYKNGAKIYVLGEEERKGRTTLFWHFSIAL